MTAAAKRAYNQTSRAEQAEANTQRVLDAAVHLLRTIPKLADLTLDDIAAESNVTVRTILRHFGTRDALLESAFTALGDDISSHRQETRPGDVDAALSSLLTHYEKDGDLNIRALQQESDYDIVHQALERGRSYHREWIETVFAPQLKPLTPAARKQRVTELYAATDVYLWKLLRRDLGNSAAATSATMHNLVRAVLAAPTK